MPTRSPWEEKLRGIRGGTREPQFKDHHARKQIVFKVTSHIKTKSGVKTVADYISSNGGSAKRSAFDENGHELKGDDILKEIEDWNLITNSENLSRKAREISTQERQDLTTKERFRHVQANHLILSFPVEHGEVSDRQLHDITQQFLRPLAEEGHRAIYSIHRHQNNPHVHILVRSQGNSGRFRLAKSQLRALRGWGAHVARENGLNVYAHGREARHDVVKAIEEGKAPLRKTDSTWRQDQKRKSERTGRTLLQRQVPAWYERHGLEFEARRNGTTHKIDNRPKDVQLPPLTERASQAIDQPFKSAFAQPEAARRSFLEMLAENRKTAMWYVNHRPDVFGQTMDENAKVKLTDRHLRISDKWRIDARRTIEGVQSTVRPDERNKILVFADLFRNQANERRAKRGREFELKRLNQILEAQGIRLSLPELSKPASEPTKPRLGLGQAVKDALSRLSAPRPHATPAPEQTPPTKGKGETVKDRQTTDARIQARADQLYRDIQSGKGSERGRGAPGRARTRGRDTST